MFHHIQFHSKIIFCVPTPCYFGLVSIWWQLWRLMSECSQFFVLGDPRVLYNSVHNHLFTLPDDFYVYPAHDYKGKKIRSRCSLFVELFSEKKFIESQLRICFHYFATPLAPLWLFYLNICDPINTVKYIAWMVLHAFSWEWGTLKLIWSAREGPEIY